MRKSLMGLAVLAFCLGTAGPAPAQNLVTNPGFETGNFSGWTLSGDTSFTGVFAFMPHSGTYAAELGPLGLGMLSQTLATVAGQEYTISYWLENDGGTPNEFRTSFGGTVLTDGINLPAFGYTQFTFTATATSSSTVLQFAYQQVPAFFHLDDVSVTPVAVPEPSTIGMAGMAGLLVMGRWVSRRRRSAA